MYSASPCTLRTTTRTRKALPSVPPCKRVRLNSGKLLKSKHNFVSVPLVPLLTLVTIPTRNRRAPADYLQGDARDVSCLGYIKSTLAS